MPIKPISRITQRQQVYEQLYHLITSASYSLGDRLPPIEELALRFGTSPRTVHLALQDLNAKGYVSLKHGSGTFITSQYRPLSMNDTIAVCMEAEAHVFGELSSALVTTLNERQLVPLVIDTATDQTTALLLRISHTDAGCFLVHASAQRWHLIKPCLMAQHKPVISFITSIEPDSFPGLYRVLTDFDRGGRLVARYLWEKGHRYVLVLGTQTAATLWTNPDAKRLIPGTSFIEEWEALGGRWDHMETRADNSSPSGCRLEEERFYSLFTASAAPTAIFGIRDADVWEAQKFICSRIPSLVGKVDLCGYFDTPWSKAANPPFTSVNLDLPAMAQAGIRMLEAIRSKRPLTEGTAVIHPYLVIR